ncbi:MAG: PEGA domain-containing protein [Calditrichaeota bacterium]|nr:MAG: PEGA domain-containing protein [Calditrichota bacterium]
MILKEINDRYEIRSTIKRGGFGIIYKGYDRILEKTVAIKKISPELMQDEKFRALFQREARYAAKLNHPNIVHIYDLVVGEDGQYFMIMEYIDGLDLQRLLNKCRDSKRLIPHHLAIYIIAEVCKALDYAHNCRDTETREPIQLIHHDISPSNIMVSSSGVVKLIDFGIAAVQRQLVPVTHALELTVQGKIPYLSPEQVQEDGQVDHRSDLFSLGLVLYELLTGKKFFENKEKLQILDILKNSKIKIQDLPGHPKALQQILQKALAKSPEERYQNANQFYLDLMTYLMSMRDLNSLDAELAQFVKQVTAGELPGEHQMPLPPEDGLQNILTSVEKDDEGDILASIFEEDEASMSPPAEKEKATIREPEAQPALQDYFDLEDEVNTVIDVIRLAARGHKTLMKRFLLGTIACGMVFMILDFVFHWTSLGTGLYDYVFPPAIKIQTIPAGAQVYLNDKLYPGTTPVSIGKIKPGVYELKLVLDGYAPIKKSIHVLRKGEVRIKGLENRPGYRPYVFHFRTTVFLNSNLPGAEVYINGLKYGKLTPCFLTWEVGEKCQIEMHKAGYEALDQFVLDTERKEWRMRDKRMWSVNMIEQPSIKYQITGLFGKYITIKSNPSLAQIYLDENPDPVGVTGDIDRFYLTAGVHKIRLVRKGYNTREFELTIDETTPASMMKNLSRPVKFTVFEANNPHQQLKARITKLIINGRTLSRQYITPCTINLFPFTYYAIISKEGYQDTRVKISPTARTVKVELKPALADISIAVLDANGNPVKDVKIKVKSLDEPNKPEIFLGITDEAGICGGTLEPGLYLFRAVKDNFNLQEKPLMVTATNLNLVEFNFANKN